MAARLSDRTCEREGCDRRLTLRNRSGFCPGSCYEWARYHGRRDTPQRPAAAGGAKVCPDCPERGPQSLEAFPRAQRTADGRGTYCLPCQSARTKASRDRNPNWRAESNARTRAWTRRLREEMIAAYGGRCACCGETEHEFLTLDHVDGVIPLEHRDEKRRSRRARHTAVYSDLKRKGWPRAGYRLLCWNCNCAIGMYGACPHERIRHLEVVAA